MRIATIPQKTLIVLAGPTAVGKTGIAIQLAKNLGTEIISADSRQCYQGMRIGTAQPSAEELEAVPHHFIDCYLPEVALNAADFEQFALKRLESIFSNNDFAIVCGGTGLYIKALCEGLDEMPAIDSKIEQKINEQYKQLGIAWLQNELVKVDSIFSKNSAMDNPARMIRALVFKLSTGQSILEFQTGTRKERPFRIVKIALELPRELLYERINKRVETMMADGLLGEAKALFHKRQLKNLQTVGYSELFGFLDQQTSLEWAIDKIKQHSRNYAKRQITWFKKDSVFHWLRADDEIIINKILAFLNSNN